MHAPAENNSRRIVEAAVRDTIFGLGFETGVLNVKPIKEHLQQLIQVHLLPVGSSALTQGLPARDDLCAYPHHCPHLERRMTGIHSATRQTLVFDGLANSSPTGVLSRSQASSRRGSPHTEAESGKCGRTPLTWPKLMCSLAEVGTGVESSGDGRKARWLRRDGALYIMASRSFSLTGVGLASSPSSSRAAFGRYSMSCTLYSELSRH